MRIGDDRAPALETRDDFAGDLALQVGAQPGQKGVALRVQRAVVVSVLDCGAGVGGKVGASRDLLSASHSTWSPRPMIQIQSNP